MPQSDRDRCRSGAGWLLGSTWRKLVATSVLLEAGESVKIGEHVRSRVGTFRTVAPSVKRRRIASRAFGVAAAGVIVMVMVGCTPIDRLSVRYVEGVLQFASCHTVDANLLEVAVRSAADPTVIEPVWLVEGDIRVRPGDIFTFGEQVEGLITVVDGDFPSGAREVYVSVGARDESGGFRDLRTARFFVADIREGEWTRSNGSRGDEPCEQPS